MGGFRQPGDGEARADWTALANATSNAFDPNRNAELREAFVYLTSEPPRRFVVEAGRLGWYPSNPTAGISETSKVVGLIRQVRNNLFHGGKFAPDSHSGTDRDSRLIRASLVLLRELLPLSPQVQAAYVD